MDPRVFRTFIPRGLAIVLSGFKIYCRCTSLPKFFIVLEMGYYSLSIFYLSPNDFSFAGWYPQFAQTT